MTLGTAALAQETPPPSADPAAAPAPDAMAPAAAEAAPAPAATPTMAAPVSTPAPTPQAEYPWCSKTVTDGCKQRGAGTDTPRAHRKPRG
jgi:hypothetical protein